MFSVLVNPLNASTAFLKDGLEDLVGRISPLTAEEEVPAAEMGKILGWAHKAGAGIIRGMLIEHGYQQAFLHLVLPVSRL